jgi:hypothetical protein
MRMAKAPAAPDRILWQARLVLLCVVLVLLASAERRLWEQDLNRPDLVGLMGPDTGKVVTLLAEIDRVPEVTVASVQLGPAFALPQPTRSIVPKPDVGHPRSRAPPR